MKCLMMYHKIVPHYNKVCETVSKEKASNRKDECTFMMTLGRDSFSCCRT